MIAAAMISVLPALDANDKHKTVAALDFYISVLSSSGELTTNQFWGRAPNANWCCI
jgi:hypothetical protein